MQVNGIVGAIKRTIVLFLMASCCWVVCNGLANAQVPETYKSVEVEKVTEKAPEKTKEIGIELGERTIQFKVPVRWKSKKPIVNFIKHDLRIEKVAGDPKEARMTFSIASGAAKANIERWKGQFTLATDDAVKVKAEKNGDYDITVVEINGSYHETMGGPFAGGKKTLRPDYVMLAAIIGKGGANPQSQKCFVKLVGPKATVKKDAKVFREMVKNAKFGEQPTGANASDTPLAE